jgi:microcompartment protein CcmL/EutN
MQALGLIETLGLVVAIESADAMLKAADVNILEKTYVGGGLVVVTVTGDVAAVKAAVEAGGAAVRKINATLLVSQHVIPNPHDDLENVIISAVPLKDRETPTTQSLKTKSDEEIKMDLNERLNKEVIDKMVKEYCLEKTIVALSKLKVVELRNLAREYKNFGIMGRAVSKANKKLLLAEFTKYYGDK